MSTLSRAGPHLGGLELDFLLTRIDADRHAGSRSNHPRIIRLDGMGIEHDAVASLEQAFDMLAELGVIALGEDRERNFGWLAGDVDADRAAARQGDDAERDEIEQQLDL